jgi:hypothetical protein
MTLLDELQAMNRSQLRKWMRDFLINCRIWVQEHGELALIAGVLSGIMLIVAYKLIIALLLLCAVAVCLLFYVAPQDNPSSSGADTTASNNSVISSTTGTNSEDFKPNDSADLRKENKSANASEK